MVALARKTFWFATVIGVLVGIGACSVPSGSQPTVSALAIGTSPSPALQPCASNEFAVPENVLKAGKELGRYEACNRVLELGRQQYGWLSVQLDLVRSVIRYGEPIPLRLTITNETDHPVIFARPQGVEFLYLFSFPPLHPSFTPPPHPAFDLSACQVATYPYSPIQLWVDLTPFPDNVGPPAVFGFNPRKPQAFSMLRPGQSCTVEWDLTWNGPGVSPLTGPFPPGNYTLRVFLRGVALGPEIPNRPIITILDIGGWVGTSEASNPVTLTILPPK